MNEWWLIFGLAILGVSALPFMVYPFYKSKAQVFAVIPLFIIAISVAYWRWGAWTDWQKFMKTQASQRQVEAVLKTIKSPAELVQRIKARLALDPKSTRGWYLLGRLYASQGQWVEAREAFSTAHQLSPEDEATTVNYLNSLWQLNQQQLNSQIREQFKILLQKNPKQPDTLAMLAMDAFTNQDYQLAINYWQKLLELATEGSEEGEMIRKAIARAQANL